MRILICDDDVLMIKQLKKLITSYFQERHINCPELSCFSDGESLLADTKEKDILFLDVEMPGMNGIYIGNELKKHNKDIKLSCDKYIWFLILCPTVVFAVLGFLLG